MPAYNASRLKPSCFILFVGRGTTPLMAFETEIKIHFDEADPAGMAFAGNLFTKMHRCYEDFIVALNQDSEKFFLGSTLLYPLRHFEGDYLQPLLPLHTYQVHIGVLKISASSFQLQYEVRRQASSVMACFRSTHVAVVAKTFVKTAIPETLRQNLEKFVIGQ